MIYFVRHGETDSNASKTYAGQKDVLLNSKGLIQAKVLAKELENTHFDVCYCSPLMRARQTCDEILRLQDGLKVYYDDRLKERFYGDLQGKSKMNLPYNLWKVGDDKKGLAEYNIEPVMQIYNRVANFYDEILKDQKDKNILVVAHSGIGRITESYFNGVPEDYDFSKIHFPNAEVVTFDEERVKTKSKKQEFGC